MMAQGIFKTIIKETPQGGNYSLCYGVVKGNIVLKWPFDLVG